MQNWILGRSVYRGVNNLVPHASFRVSHFSRPACSCHVPRAACPIRKITRNMARDFIIEQATRDDY